MRKAKSRTLDVRKTFTSSGTVLVSLPKEQIKYMQLQSGDPVALMQKREGEEVIELKDGDIVIRTLKSVI